MVDLIAIIVELNTTINIATTYIHYFSNLSLSLLLPSLLTEICSIFIMEKNVC